MRDSSPELWPTGRRSGTLSRKLPIENPGAQTLREHLSRRRLLSLVGASVVAGDTVAADAARTGSNRDDSESPRPPDWRAFWIDAGTGEQASLENAHWIWFPEGEPAQAAPVGTRYFRKPFDIGAARKIEHASVTLKADNEFVLFVNGVRILKSSGYGVTSRSGTGSTLMKRALSCDARV